jgi:hypothetical protein
MRYQALTAGAVLACLLTAAPIVAKDKAQKSKPTSKSVEPKKVEAVAAAPQLHANASPQHKAPVQPPHPPQIVEDKEPWVSVNVRIGDHERQVIRTYVEAQNSKSKKAKGLPPGLAKKVARGGSLPPGWQKKCVRGEIMPPAVYRQCHPLPQEVAVKLPPPPPGTILVAVHGKIVRLIKASREILDVFDVI